MPKLIGEYYSPSCCCAVEVYRYPMNAAGNEFSIRTVSINDRADKNPIFSRAEIRFHSRENKPEWKLLEAVITNAGYASRFAKLRLRVRSYQTKQNAPSDTAAK